MEEAAKGTGGQVVGGMSRSEPGGGGLCLPCSPRHDPPAKRHQAAPEACVHPFSGSYGGFVTAMIMTSLAICEARSRIETTLFSRLRRLPW